MPVYEFTAVEVGHSWANYHESWEEILNPTIPGAYTAAEGLGTIGLWRSSIGDKVQKYSSWATFFRFDTSSIAGQNIISSQLSFKSDDWLDSTGLESTLSSIAQGNLAWYSDTFMYSRDHLITATRWSPVDLLNIDQNPILHTEEYMSVVASDEYVIVFTGDNFRTGIAPPDSPADGSAYYYGGRMYPVLADVVITLTTYDPIPGSDVLFGAFSV